MNKERKLNPPFRWAAPPMTKVELSAIRVVDAEAGLRMELFTPAPNGERLVQGIDVPFMPTAMHADCISIKNHERKTERAVRDAVAAAVAEANARAEAAEARAQVAEENMANLTKTTNATVAGYEEQMRVVAEEGEKLRRQSAALHGVMAVVSDIDRLDLLFLHKPAFAHTLRVKLKAYGAAQFTEYVSKDEHEAALARVAEERKHDVARAKEDVVTKLRKAFEGCSLVLSRFAMKNANTDISSALKAIEDSFALLDR